MNERNQAKIEKRKPLSVWQLPTLLESVHEFRKPKNRKKAKDRPHYPAIIAFIHRNRFATASQTQRRFPGHLKSDRTTRRHLEELQSLGFLDTVQPPSPLWPKTYFATARGIKRLQSAYSDKNIDWKPLVVDRYRRIGFSPAHVTHELFITELSLTAWQVAQSRDDLELLSLQRRILARHPAFQITMAGRHTKLAPDGMLLLRQDGAKMICCFLEVDLSTMGERQWKGKLRRYANWAESESGNRWLVDLYCSYGATNPRPMFRVLTVANNVKRADTLVKWTQPLHSILRRRMRFTSTEDVVKNPENAIPLSEISTDHIIL